MQSAPRRRDVASVLVALIASWPALGQARPSRLLPQKLPVESPESIALRIVSSYRDGKPLPLEKMPLVPRLQDALRRTDLASDPIVEPDRPISRLVIDMAEVMGEKRARVVVRFSERNDERLIKIDFDITSGDWLITDIIPSSGPSLRQLLRISR